MSRHFPALRALIIPTLIAAAHLSPADAAPPKKPAAKPKASNSGPDLPSKLPLSSPFVTVNGEQISVAFAIDRLSLTYAPQLREALVMETLIQQEANRRKISATNAEVTAMVGKVFQDYALRAGGEQRLADELKNSRGWSITDFKAVIRDQTNVQILRQKLAENLVPAKSITDAEIEARYNDRKESFHQPESVRISHVLFQRHPSDSSKDNAARTKAEALLKQVMEARGGNFDALAKQQSEDETTRGVGGRVASPIVKGANPFGTAFEVAVFGAPVGVVPRVVVSPMGYHVIRVDSAQPERDVPLADVRNQLQDSLLAEQREKGLDELLVKLRGSARIDSGRF